MNSSHWIVVRSTSLDSVNSMRISRIMKQPKAPFASESNPIHAKDIFVLVRCVTITNKTLWSYKTPDTCTPFLNFIWSFVIHWLWFMRYFQIVVLFPTCKLPVGTTQLFTTTWTEYGIILKLAYQFMLCLQHYCIDLCYAFNTIAWIFSVNPL